MGDAAMHALLAEVGWIGGVAALAPAAADASLLLAVAERVCERVRIPLPSAAPASAAHPDGVAAAQAHRFSRLSSLCAALGVPFDAPLAHDISIGARGAAQALLLRLRLRCDGPLAAAPSPRSASPARGHRARCLASTGVATDVPHAQRLLQKGLTLKQIAAEMRVAPFVAFAEEQERRAAAADAAETAAIEEAQKVAGGRDRNRSEARRSFIGGFVTAEEAGHALELRRQLESKRLNLAWELTAQETARVRAHNERVTAAVDMRTGVDTLEGTVARAQGRALAAADTVSHIMGGSASGGGSSAVGAVGSVKLPPLRIAASLMSPSSMPSASSLSSRNALSSTATARHASASLSATLPLPPSPRRSVAVTLDTPLLASAASASPPFTTSVLSSSARADVSHASKGGTQYSGAAVVAEDPFATYRLPPSLVDLERTGRRVESPRETLQRLSSASEVGAKLRESVAFENTLKMRVAEQRFERRERDTRARVGAALQERAMEEAQRTARLPTAEALDREAAQAAEAIATAARLRKAEQREATASMIVTQEAERDERIKARAGEERARLEAERAAAVAAAAPRRAAAAAAAAAAEAAATERDSLMGFGDGNAEGGEDGAPRRYDGVPEVVALPQGLMHWPVSTDGGAAEEGEEADALEVQRAERLRGEGTWALPASDPAHELLHYRTDEGVAPVVEAPTWALLSLPLGGGGASAAEADARAIVSALAPSSDHAPAVEVGPLLRLPRALLISIAPPLPSASPIATAFVTSVAHRLAMRTRVTHIESRDVLAASLAAFDALNANLIARITADTATAVAANAAAVTAAAAAAAEAAAHAPPARGHAAHHTSTAVTAAAPAFPTPAPLVGVPSGPIAHAPIFNAVMRNWTHESASAVCKLSSWPELLPLLDDAGLDALYELGAITAVCAVALIKPALTAASLATGAELPWHALLAEAAPLTSSSFALSVEQLMEGLTAATAACSVGSEAATLVASLCAQRRAVLEGGSALPPPVHAGSKGVAAKGHTADAPPKAAAVKSKNAPAPPVTAPLLAAHSHCLLDVLAPTHAFAAALGVYVRAAWQRACVSSGTDNDSSCGGGVLLECLPATPLQRVAIEWAAYSPLLWRDRNERGLLNGGSGGSGGGGEGGMMGRGTLSFFAPAGWDGRLHSLLAKLSPPHTTAAAASTITTEGSGGDGAALSTWHLPAVGPAAWVTYRAAEHAWQQAQEDAAAAALAAAAKLAEPPATTGGKHAKAPAAAPTALSVAAKSRASSAASMRSDAKGGHHAAASSVTPAVAPHPPPSCGAIDLLLSLHVGGSEVPAASLLPSPAASVCDVICGTLVSAAAPPSRMGVTSPMASAPPSTLVAALLALTPPPAVIATAVHDVAKKGGVVPPGSRPRSPAAGAAPSRPRSPAIGAAGARKAHASQGDAPPPPLPLLEALSGAPALTTTPVTHPLDAQTTHEAAPAAPAATRASPSRRPSAAAASSRPPSAAVAAHSPSRTVSPGHSRPITPSKGHAVARAPHDSPSAAEVPPTQLDGASLVVDAAARLGCAMLSIPADAALSSSSEAVCATAGRLELALEAALQLNKEDASLLPLRVDEGEHPHSELVTRVLAARARGVRLPSIEGSQLASVLRAFDMCSMAHENAVTTALLAVQRVQGALNDRVCRAGRAFLRLLRGIPDASIPSHCTPVIAMRQAPRGDLSATLVAARLKSVEETSWRRKRGAVRGGAPLPEASALARSMRRSLLRRTPAPMVPLLPLPAARAAPAPPPPIAQTELVVLTEGGITNEALTALAARVAALEARAAAADGPAVAASLCAAADDAGAGLWAHAESVRDAALAFLDVLRDDACVGEAQRSLREHFDALVVADVRAVEDRLCALSLIAQALVREPAAGYERLTAPVASSDADGAAAGLLYPGSVGEGLLSPPAPLHLVAGACLPSPPSSSPLPQGALLDAQPSTARLTALALRAAAAPALSGADAASDHVVRELLLRIASTEAAAALAATEPASAWGDMHAWCTQALSTWLQARDASIHACIYRIKDVLTAAGDPQAFRARVAAAARRARADSDGSNTSGGGVEWERTGSGLGGPPLPLPQLRAEDFAVEDADGIDEAYGPVAKEVDDGEEEAPVWGGQ